MLFLSKDCRLKSSTKSHRNWHPYCLVHLNIENKSTDELAELGYFITRSIERFGFDSAVGTGKNKPNPQVRFVPNRKVDYGHNKRQIV